MEPHHPPPFGRRALPLLIALTAAMASSTGPPLRGEAQDTPAPAPLVAAPRPAARQAPPAARPPPALPLDPDEPRPELGASIDLPAPVERIAWRVGPGDTLKNILHMWGLTPGELRELNPDVRNLTAPGAHLTVYARPGRLKSISVGAANKGWLIDGVPLPEGPGYTLLHRHRTFGTHTTVALLQEVLHLDHARWPAAQPLLIGDLSFASGRRITPHRSHRTGRDVDIGLPHTDGAPQRWFYSGSIDIPRTWTLVEALLRTGQIEYVFLDWRLQGRLREHAATLGITDEALDAWFQYPAWGNRARAPVRHERGHDDHLHVRFVCQPTDENCIAY